jgi:hypothetical protein
MKAAVEKRVGAIINLIIAKMRGQFGKSPTTGELDFLRGMLALVIAKLNGRELCNPVFTLSRPEMRAALALEGCDTAYVNARAFNRLWQQFIDEPGRRAARLPLLTSTGGEHQYRITDRFMQLWDRTTEMALGEAIPPTCPSCGAWYQPTGGQVECDRCAKAAKPDWTAAWQVRRHRPKAQKHGAHSAPPPSKAYPFGKMPLHWREMRQQLPISAFDAAHRVNVN